MSLILLHVNILCAGVYFVSFLFSFTGFVIIISDCVQFVKSNVEVFWSSCFALKRFLSKLCDCKISEVLKHSAVLLFETLLYRMWIFGFPLISCVGVGCVYICVLALKRMTSDYSQGVHCVHSYVIVS